MSKTFNLESAAQAVQYVRQAITALVEQRSKLQVERSELTARNQLLYDGPVSRDEAKDYILQWIDSRATGFVQEAQWNKLFESFAHPKGQRPSHGDATQANQIRHSGPLSLADLDLARGFSFLEIMAGSNFVAGFEPSPDLAVKAIHFLLADQLKAKVAKHFDDMFPDIARGTGRAIAEMGLEARRAEIERNDTRILAIDEETQATEEQIAAMETVGPREPAPRLSMSIDALRALP